jgi:hypothetical protein
MAVCTQCCPCAPRGINLFVDLGEGPSLGFTISLGGTGGGATPLRFIEIQESARRSESRLTVGSGGSISSSPGVHDSLDQTVVRDGISRRFGYFAFVGVGL